MSTVEENKILAARRDNFGSSYWLQTEADKKATSYTCLFPSAAVKRRKGRAGCPAQHAGQPGHLGWGSGQLLLALERLYGVDDERGGAQGGLLGLPLVRLEPPHVVVDEDGEDDCGETLDASEHPEEVGEAELFERGEEGHDQVAERHGEVEEAGHGGLHGARGLGVGEGEAGDRYHHFGHRHAEVLRQLPQHVDHALT